MHVITSAERYIKLTKCIPSLDISSSSNMFHAVLNDVKEVGDKKAGSSFPASTNSCEEHKAG